MADDSTIIYNFSALESAIESFDSSANTIASLAGDIKNIDPEVRAAVEATSGEILADKVSGLSDNVSKAHESLKGRINGDLKKYLEQGQQAERAAENVASSVSTFKMD